MSDLSGPWHAGERAAQRRAGVADQVKWAAQHIRAEIPPVASLLRGEEGFAHVVDERHVRLACPPLAGDALARSLGEGVVQLGMLAIEPQTRRRMRVNGKAELRDGGIDIYTEQVYANCPKYITVRSPSELTGTVPVAAGAVRSTRLSATDRRLIRDADTFFVATAHAKAGADASHRGGDPGFLEAPDSAHLTWPDYVGNGFMNTIGNLEVDPAAGLLIIDWDTGDVLQVAGKARTDWDANRAATIPGAQRVNDMTVEQVVRHRAALGRRWVLVDRSPMNPPARHDEGQPLSANGAQPGRGVSTLTSAGNGHARAPLDASATGAARPAASLAWAGFRRFTVTAVADETPTARSFALAPVDGADLDPHAPGQFVPVRIRRSEDSTPLIRNYSLSTWGHSGRLRITVKRCGQASAWLQDNITLGHVVEIGAPRGLFTLDPQTSSGALVLISAGIGVTPLHSMLAALSRAGSQRSITWIQVAHSIHECAHLTETRQYLSTLPGARAHVRVSRLNSGDDVGCDLAAQGRLTAQSLRDLRLDTTADAYVCGPNGFMNDVRSWLYALGFAHDAVHTESFTASLAASDTRADSRSVGRAAATTVTFARSGMTVPWGPDDGTLLELAEAHAVPVASSCRIGTCHTCLTTLIAGATSYAPTPMDPGPNGAVLLCCSRPMTAVSLDL
jgi:ferredoxin-NADP reductase/predicted pyridoxine 5'-phosphate oxidase superfamily flavin-nucleotide-binding protein